MELKLERKTDNQFFNPAILWWDFLLFKSKKGDRRCKLTIIRNRTYTANR